MWALPKDVLFNVICPYLDQVSFFRLARTSKTLYDVLNAYLPKEAVLEHFNWKFKAKNIETSWKHARKRHESGEWCLGGCGKRRKPKKDTLPALVIYKRARTAKKPLNICAVCMRQRRSLHREDDILPDIKRLKRQLIEKDITCPLIPILDEYEDKLTLSDTLVNQICVGDVMVPKYRWYTDEKYRLFWPTELEVVEIEDSCWYDRNKHDRRYVMSDGSTIDSTTGQRWECHSSSQFEVYVKKLT